MRTQKIEDCYRHLANSMKVVKLMEEKVAKFDYDLQKKLVGERNYEALEMYVLELLLGM
jgi:xylose isomerase